MVAASNKELRYCSRSVQLTGIPYIEQILSILAIFRSIVSDKSSTFSVMFFNFFLAFLFLVISLINIGIYIAAPAAITPIPAAINVSSSVTPTSTIGVPAAMSTIPRLSLSAFSFSSVLSRCIFDAVTYSFLIDFSSLSSSRALFIPSAGRDTLKVSLSWSCIAFS